jgi:ribosomal protein S6--L-glutamate ligase
MPPHIIRDNATFDAEHENLEPGDIIVGRVRLKPGEEHLLLDLLARKVTLIPSAVSQMCSRSKVYQARVLGNFMIPGTAAIYDRQDVLTLVGEYNSKGFGQVVCKLDRANGGQGILLFASVEEVFNHATLGTLPFPFVVQPYLEEVTDVRAVILGDRVEAYTRYNPNNFRQNLHCGGKSSPYQLTDDQLHLCRNAMRRAEFPYGTVDLLIQPDGRTWLSEINLRGGLRGASMSQQDYLDATEEIHTSILSDCLDERGKD